MNRLSVWPLLALFGLFFPMFSLAQDGKYTPTDAERAQIEAGIRSLTETIDGLKSTPPSEAARHSDNVADVEVCLKAAEWILREDEFYKKSYLDMTLRALKLGEERAKLLAEGKSPWRDRPGGTAHGYVSKVDGSVQPFALYVPESYDGQTPTRLDVVLHGRNGTLTESSFLAAHEGKPYPEGETGLILHVYGRGNNAYRWAGETDVFEAMKAVERNYRVDPRRVLLRGFSMGGAGAWHLGLHHPREWCSVEAGAGFSESKKYAKLTDLLDCQDQMLHIYDAQDYALNAFNVPIAGYGGENDPQRQASENIVQALQSLGLEMETEGLVTRARSIDFIRVVGAKMGHKIDPESAKILKQFRDEHAEKGLDLRPDAVRFVTYTLAYSQAPWLQVEALRQHYRKTLVEGHVEDDVLVVTKWDNVAMLSISRDIAATVRFGDDDFPLRPAVGGLLPNVTFQKVENGWHQLDYDQSRALQLNAKRQKRPGLQGPIDHAFTGSFLCVRGTGRAWNPNVQAWVDARLSRFQKEWRTYMRGEIRVKDDDDLTQDDIDDHHLILFGDPGSNQLIAKLRGILPMTWTKTEVSVGGGPAFASADHVPALVVANPLNPLRYLVINSGPTFDARAFQGTNALLYPRLGDFAMLRVLNQREEVQTCGFFDEFWKIPEPQDEAPVTEPGK